MGCPAYTSCPGPFKAHVAEDVVMVYQDFLLWQTSIAQSCKEKSVPEMFLFVWWMTCTYNGWALPLQINQTWHCPALEHLGRPRDRIKGPARPWTLSVPNMHSKLESGYPVHFSHHHLHWLCLLVISYFCLIRYSHIPQSFRHGNSGAECGAAWQYSKSIYELIIPQQNYIFS